MRVHSDEAKKIAKECYLAGMSCKEISRKIGIAVPTVKYWMRSLGIMRTSVEGRELWKRSGKSGGSYHPLWNGGKWLDKRGYMMVSLGKGDYAFEHVLIAEKLLKRPLKPNEVVHHINGNKADNRNCNLIICERSLHQKMHAKMSLLYMQEHFNH